MKMTLLQDFSIDDFGQQPNVDLFGQQLLRIQYEKGDDKRRTGIFFHKVAAAQATSLRLKPSWQGDHGFALFEVNDSPWKQRMLELAWESEHDPGYRDRKRHYLFMTYDWNFEILADSWELLPDKEGWETDAWQDDWRRLYWSR